MSGKIGRAGPTAKKNYSGPQPNSAPDAFFRRLNFLLVTQKISARKMSRDTGLCRDSLYYHKRNGTMPSGEQILTICRYFKVSADWMMGLSYDMSGKCNWCNP